MTLPNQPGKSTMDERAKAFMHRIGDGPDGPIGSLTALLQEVASEAAEASRQEAALIIKQLSYGADAVCWCEMAVGNPMYSHHAESCNEAREFILSLKSTGKTVPTDREGRADRKDGGK